MASHIFWQLHIIIVVYMKGETKMFESKKYKLLKRYSINYDGHTLYKIKYLKDFIDCRGITIKKGTLGGYVENYDILDQNGNACILGGAKVYGKSKITGASIISGESAVESSIIDSSHIRTDSSIYNSIIKNYSRISESSIYNSSINNSAIGDESKIYGAFVKNCRILCTRINSTEYHLDVLDKYEELDDDGFPYDYHRKDVFENSIFNNCDLLSNNEYINIDSLLYFKSITIFPTNEGKYGINLIDLNGYCHTKSICDFEDMCHKEFEDAADAIIKTVKDCISIMELHAHKESIKNVDNYIRDAIISAASLNIDDTRKFLNTILYKAKDLLDNYDKMIKEGIKDAEEC